MSAFGPKAQADGAPVLPCWIGGHAYLTMAELFADVVGADGQAMRRVPMCGEGPVQSAVESAAAAVPTWHAMAEEARHACFAELDALLTRYGAHLAKLVGEESGLDAEHADAEVRDVLTALGARAAMSGPACGVAAVICDALAPLAGPAACTIDALAAGWAVILKPSPKAPSALFALAEIFTRAGFPDGLVNIVHGDEAAVQALCRSSAVAALAFAGGDRVGDKVRAIAAENGKAFAGGMPDVALAAAWRRCLASNA